jgi:hypothetical protein
MGATYNPTHAYTTTASYTPAGRANGVSRGPLPFAHPRLASRKTPHCTAGTIYARDVNDKCP